ncbi:MAG: beta-ketoadipyl CoA thiolase [Anaerolineae bacterium SG8_19]|jgi:acetyl-CoA C-acetyltransferase|nr:MAG: beta-ketoadipyl CoA thiolase [Anaerolineae bacterium SG8_19]HCB50768.1 3-oxoadipyl-CoA thiolase [Chloroflexota bacterium]
MSKEVVIVSAVRTPIGSHGGILSAVRPDDLAALVIRDSIQRAGIKPDIVEEVYFGCANQAGEDNRNVARMATLLAGFPEHIAAVTVNRLCASGLNAVNQAARAILAGEGDVFIAGGVESMSRAPYSFPKNPRAWGPPGNITGWDTTLGWRYPNPKMEALFPLEAMGETAENIYSLSCSGKIEGGQITREEQDAFAYESQRRAYEAIRNGHFKDEILPVSIPQRKGDPIIMDTDEHPRIKKNRDDYELTTSPELLAKLKPVFREGGTVTAGNASGLNDGAAALVLMSTDKAEELNVQPMASWLASGAAGVDPRTMGLGPVPATRKALQRASLSLEDIDLIELNEAFAVQSLAVIRELGLNPKITNVNGGAIALGHPLGCSGARILTTLLHEMKRRSEKGEFMKYGLATLCVGVGQGEATIVKLIA